MTRNLPVLTIGLLSVFVAPTASAQSEPFCATRNTHPDGTETDTTYQSVQQYMGGQVTLMAVEGAGR